MKHLGVRMVVDGKQDSGTTYVYVGVGLGAAEQLLLASVRPISSCSKSNPTGYSLKYLVVADTG